MNALAELELDLDVFTGPFDLLLALVLRSELEPAEVPIADIVTAYVEQAHASGALNLEVASEFLVLVAALLEVKLRLLFPGEELEPELTPEQAEEELAQRLLDYHRYRGAAGWLRGRLAGEARVFRTGPPPLAPRPVPVVVAGAEDPGRLVAVLERLLEPPPAIDTSAVRRPLVPLGVVVERLRGILRERNGFAFEEVAAGLDPLAQATAFLAVLELVRRGEAAAEQRQPFAPIRIRRRRAAASEEERAIA